MADSNKTALQVLREMRQERDELNAAIQALEKRLGITVPAPESYTAKEEEESAGFPPMTSMPIGFFHNLSLAAAAEKLLSRNPGQPYTTAQILEAFRTSGLVISSKNAATILYTALKRSPKFERVGSKAWGLKEWYPERKKRISKDQNEEETASE